jgi:glycosyltransferase involved in cell wall biosynthesis
MSHWFIIEPNLTGHRTKYLQEFASLGLSVGHRISVALADRPANRTVLEAAILPRGPHIQYHFFSISKDHERFGGLANDLRREFAYWRFARLAFRTIDAQQPIDHVLFPYFDYCINVSGLIGTPMKRCPIYGVVMRPTFHFSAMGVNAPAKRFNRLRENLFKLALGRQDIQGVLAIDQTLAEYAHRCPHLAWKKLRYMPDPSDALKTTSKSQARETLGLPPKARVLLVYGALDGRKGIHELLNAAIDSQAPSDLQIVLAGRLSPDLRKQLHSPQIAEWLAQGQLHLHDRHIADEEESLFFSAADAVWVGYKGHYTMSGVLIKAGRAGRQVLFSDTGLIGWYSAKLTNAISVGQLALDDIVPALHKISVSPEFSTSNLFLEHEWPTAVAQALPEFLHCD